MNSILLVEDNDDQRMLIKEVFKMSGVKAELTEAPTGSAAMDCLKDGKFDLILLDHRLPGITGLEILEKIRARKDRTPVVMMTAETSAQLAVEAMRLGISDFVLKEGAFQVNLPAIAQKIFEHSDMARKLATAQAESEFNAAKLSGLGKILSEVLHDLRNPLSIISTSLEAIRDAQDKEKAVNMSLDLMLRNVERGRQIINSLLDFSRPKDYSFESASLKDAVAELVGHLKLKCRNQSIDLQMDIPDGLQDIRLDVSHFKGALLNLFMNAIEAMPKGGTLQVTANDLQESESLRLEISDTGIGIREQDQLHLFERYYTTKPSGTGLGLIMTHQVVSQHNGTIEVMSTEGSGTTFTITLPYGDER